MTHSETNHIKTARIIKVVCGLLYFIFTLSYLGRFQLFLLETIQGCLSNWQYSYDPRVGAICISLSLYLLSMCLNLITRWRDSFYALSLLPAFLLLIPLTDIHCDIYQGHIWNTHWGWIVPLVLLLDVAASFIYRRFKIKRIGLIPLLSNNLIVLSVLAILLLTFGNTDLEFHSELKMDHYIREKNFSQATEVNPESLEVSHGMAVLRSFCLSHTGSLGSSLFKYPQYYHSNGLFFTAEDDKTCYLTNQKIYAYLGDGRESGESILQYLKRLCAADTGCYAALDYYLCALLLDKHLDEFVSALNEFGDEQQLNALHYQEALILYKELHPDFQLPIGDASLEKKYKDFRQMEQEYAENYTVRRNNTRRMYSDTYWWYYKYSE